MASALNTDITREMKEVALNRALDERTDPIRLRQCIIDLRSHHLCPESWYENRVLPRLYAVSVTRNETTIGI